MEKNHALIITPNLVRLVSSALSNVPKKEK